MAPKEKWGWALVAPNPAGRNQHGMKPRMRTLPHWGHLLPLLGATLAHYFGLGWLKLARREANRADCSEPPRFELKPGPYATLPADPEDDEDDPRDFPGAWCPIHECEYWEMECPDCLWDQRWTLAEASDWYGRMCDRADYPGRDHRRVSRQHFPVWPDTGAANNAPGSCFVPQGRRRRQRGQASFMGTQLHRGCSSRAFTSPINRFCSAIARLPR